MRTAFLVLPALLAGTVAPAVAQANPYPTLETVDHVLTCMRENGGQNIDNLQRCSCEIDVIAQQLSFDDYNTARTYEVYRRMPGEKGGLFRDSDIADEYLAKLEAVRADAKKRCFVGAVRQAVVPEKGVVKPAHKAGEAAPEEAPKE